MPAIDELFQSSRQSHISGDFAAAANGYATVLTNDPTHADAWHLAGLLAHQNGRTGDGLQQIQMAIQLNPSNPEYFSNLAAILNKLGRPDDALKAADKALEIDADSGPAALQRGIACTTLDRMDEALQSLERSLTSEFADEAVLRQLAETRQYLGDIDGALEHLNASLELNPDSPTAYFQLSAFVRAGQFSFNDSQIAKIRGLLERPDSDLRTQNRLHVSLAVHFEQAGDFPQAFLHFEKANDIKLTQRASQNVHVSEANRRQVDNDIIDFFTPELFERFQGFGNSSSRPIFVLGMPRSGTTLVQQILGRHSQIIGAGELTVISDLMRAKFGDASQVRLRDRLPTFDGPWIGATADQYLQALGEKIALMPDCDEGTQPQHVVDKMPGNYLQMGFIRLMFPNAAIINCQRDPRDICLSCFCQSFESPRLQVETASLGNLAVVYRSYAQMIDHWKLVLPGGFYQIVYEELLEDPERQIARLLQYLKVEWEDDCLNFHTSKSHVLTASANQVRQPFYKTSRQKWKRYETQLQPLTELLRPEILDFAELRARSATAESECFGN